MKKTDPEILIFCMEDSKRQLISSVCRQLYIRDTVCTEEMETAPIGMLCRAQDWNNPLLNIPKGDFPPLSEEMILIAGLSEELLDRFLRESRSRGCSVSLKAVLTSHNAMWNARMLQDHMKQERAEVMRRFASGKAGAPDSGSRG